MVKDYNLPYYETCCGEDDEHLGPRHSALSSKSRKEMKKLKAMPDPAISKFLPEAQLNQCLDKWLGRAGDPQAERRVLTDSVFPRISELLKEYGKGEWSLRPRTFTILRMLGCPEALDEFMRLNRKDSFLPYSSRNLPDIIKGSARSKFLRLQQMVLCNQKDISALEEGGKHLHLSSVGNNYFETRDFLGRGKFGLVERVWSRQSLTEYARKVIHRGTSVLQDSRMCRQFEGEIQALKRLSHPHIVKLVGSYTDENQLGLIMTPIADMNLHDYLTSLKIDPVLRKRCLRSFFGCLATALTYLHDRDVRHNDIKPANVLLRVKESCIYLTDFGTSRSWGTEEQSTTLGEHEGYTPRYSAPELHDTKAGGGRNRASDIWSLGCVFLDMATILFDRTLDDLGLFLEENGTLRSDAFWANHEGARLWIKELRGTSSSSDTAVLDWTSEMLQYDSEERPTAGQLYARMCDFKADEIYMCHGCASPSGLQTPSSTPVLHPVELEPMGMNSEGDTADHQGTVDVPPQVTASALGILERPSATCTHKKCSTSPEKAKHLEKTKPKVASSGSTKAESNLETVKAVPEKAEPPLADVEVPEKASPDETPEKLNGVRFAIPPMEPERISPLEIAKETPPSEPEPDKPLEPIADAPFIESMRHLELVDDDESSSGSEMYTINTDSESLADTTDTESDIDQEDTAAPKARFEDLPEDRRPEPSERKDETEADDEFIRPEPILAPPFQRKDALPKATLVPSYILAGTNHFSNQELDNSQQGALTTNLFVYGRLMFPSVLRAIAAQSTKGIYSRALKRRIFPSSEDWAKADLSIRRASETMTPARLEGYDRWKPAGLNCAVLQASNLTRKILREREYDGYKDLQTPPPGHVDGFLILGVRPEALRYCDLLFGSSRQTMRSLRPQDDPDGDEDEDRDNDSDDGYLSRHLMQRERVAVQVETNAGSLATVRAETYVWAFGADALTNVWEEERFLRSPPMQTLQREQPTWAAEEQSLAAIMKLSFAQVGDYLAGAILGGDMDELTSLLGKRFDPNAACRVYGRPLMAAVGCGRDDMVGLLLEAGANVNAQGGQYGTALIAAAYGSRKRIMKMLLHRGADVFVEDEVHVNALYQAVAHSDYSLTDMLLEHGAWLSKHWGEILDMAEELGDREILHLLDRYDVRKIHRQHRLLKCRGEESEPEEGSGSEGGRDGRRDKDTWEGVSFSKVALAVTRKFAGVQKMSGNWKGRRGVQVTVAALDAGAPLRLIGLLRGAVSPINAIFDVLKRGDEEQERKKLELSVISSRRDDEELPRRRKRSAREDRTEDHHEARRPDRLVVVPRELERASGQQRPSDYRAQNRRYGQDRRVRFAD